MIERAAYRGVFPVAPTTFFDNEELDLESQKRVLDCMIDQYAKEESTFQNFYFYTGCFPHLMRTNRRALFAGSERRPHN